MPWSPKFIAKQEEQIVVNTLAIIVRDFQSALDYFYPSEGLEDFNERTLGMIRKLAFPCLALGPRSNPATPSDAQDRLIQEVGIDIFIGVVADNSDNTCIKIMRYQRVMDSVLRTATASDYFAGMSEQQRFGLVVEVGHIWGPIGERQSKYFGSVLMDLTVRFNER